MIVRPKHWFIGMLASILSLTIFFINYWWGNPFHRAFMLAFFTFSMFYLSWTVVWELRDFWNYRWSRFDESALHTQELAIPIERTPITTKKKLHGILLANETIDLNTPIPSANLCIVVQGFSNSLECVKFITLFLARQGFEVLTYDPRGVGKSRKAGSSHDFKAIIEDLGTVIDHILMQPRYQGRKINLIGISLGAMAALIQGVRHPMVKKVIGIAAISDFKANLPRSLVPFKGKWWLWLRYSLLGVKLYPKDELNQQISPLLQIKQWKTEVMEYSSEEAFDRLVREKYFLVHAINDKVIPINHFFRLKKTLNLPEENYNLYRKGGHMFRAYELVLLGDILRYLLK